MSNERNASIVRAVEGEKKALHGLLLGNPGLAVVQNGDKHYNYMQKKETEIFLVSSVRKTTTEMKRKRKRHEDNKQFVHVGQLALSSKCPCNISKERGRSVRQARDENFVFRIRKNWTFQHSRKSRDQERGDHLTNSRSTTYMLSKNCNILRIKTFSIKIIFIPL